MSKFTRVQTAVKDIEALKRGLRKLGVKFQEGDCNLSYDSYGRSGNNAAVVINKNTTINGFGKTGNVNRYGQFAVVPDGSGGFEFHYDSHFGKVDDTVADIVKQAYALEMLETAAASQGLTLAEVEYQPNGSIRILMQGFGIMGKTEVVASVSATGEVQAEVQGVKGEACAPIVHQIQIAIGGQVVKEENTSDFYSPPDDGSEVFRTDWAGG